MDFFVVPPKEDDVAVLGEGEGMEGGRAGGKTGEQPTVQAVGGEEAGGPGVGEEVTGWGDADPKDGVRGGGVLFFHPIFLLSLLLLLLLCVSLLLLPLLLQCQKEIDIGQLPPRGLLDVALGPPTQTQAAHT